MIVGPYTVVEDIEKEFDLDLSNIRENGISYSDHYDLIIFLRDRKSVEIVEINKVVSVQRQILSKADCVFITNEAGKMILKD